MSQIPTGGQVNYYLAVVDYPRRQEQAPYQAECEDIIAALGMTFDEGCEFKALWRTAAARKGLTKPGTDPLKQALYDAQKRVHYATQSMKMYEKILFEPDTAVMEPKKVWHPYDGTGLGGRGINKDTLLYVRYDGSIGEDGPYRPERWRWNHMYNPPSGGDIVAYRFA